MSRPSKPCFGQRFGRRQSGAALITVISVVAFLVILSTGMAVTLDREVRLSGYNQAGRQAEWLAQGVEVWSTQTLALDGEESEHDNLAEIWAAPLPVTAMEHGSVSARIEDLQGRINLNGLIKDGQRQPLQVARLRRLLTLLDIDEELVYVILDWLDEDDRVSFPHGAEDDYYLNQTPARHTANGPMASIAELKWLKGVNEALFTRLAPHVSALSPEVGGININTAGAVVLASLADGLTVQSMEQLTEERERTEGFSMEAFVQHPAFAGRELPTQELVLTSSYFQLSADVRFQDIALRRIARIWRDNDNKVQVIGRWTD